MKELNKELVVRSLVRGEFCPVCKEKRDGTQLLCDACADALAAEMRRGCAVCGKSMMECTCSTAALRRAGYAHLFKLCAYDPKREDGAVNKTVFALKHKRDRLLFRLIARLMARRLAEAIEAINAAADQKADAIVTYVPRSRRRIRKTGVDQAKLLAKYLSAELSVPSVRLLKRRFRAKTQKELSVFDRERNATSLFKLKNARKLGGKTVIIVDDLVASGNTMAQAGELLMRGGAQRVITACFATLLQKAEAERFEEYAKDVPAPPDEPSEDIFSRGE